MTDNTNHQPTVLEEAQTLVTGNRNADYDHPLDNFNRIAKMWSVIIDKEITYREVALCMDAVKISREIHRPKRDNRVDGPGYWLALDMAIAEEERRKNEHP